MKARRTTNWVAVVSNLLVVSGAIDAATALIVIGVGGGEIPSDLAGIHVLVGCTFVAFAVTCLVVSYGFRLLRTWAWTPASYTAALNIFVAYIAFRWPGLPPVAVILFVVTLVTVFAMFRPGVAILFRPRPR